MRLRLAAATLLALALAGAAWYWRGTPTVAGALRAIGAPGESATPDPAATLRAAGVRKCVGARGTSYVDGACPAGTREAAVGGGTVTVTSFPQPAPAQSALASSAGGGAIVKPMDPDERDRLRDRAIEDAANRR